MIFSLKTCIKRTFPFGKYDLAKDIIGLIAKKEGSVEYQITNHLAKGTRRRVSNTINDFLIPYGYLYEKQSTKSRRNVKNAFGKGKEIRPRMYYLTFKGFLVSLLSIKIKDNPITTKYLEFFPDDSKDDIIEYLKNEIFLYVCYNCMIGIELDSVKDVVFHIDDTQPRWDKMNIGDGLKEEFKEIENKQSKLLEKLFDDHNELFYLLDYWARALELITEGKNGDKLLEQLEKEAIWSKMDPSFLESNFKLLDLFKDERQKQIDYE